MEKKRLSRRKNEYVDHKYVKMYCTTNQLNQLEFCGPLKKPHIALRLGNNYHMYFDHKLGHGKYAIRYITCVCTQYINNLYKPWTTYMPPHKRICYETAKDCT